MPSGTQAPRRGRRSGGGQNGQTARRRQPRQPDPSSDDDDAPNSSDNQANRSPPSSDAMDLDASAATQQESLQQLTKALVRYALSSEHSRTSIRRDAIKEKILTAAHARRFRAVFDSAQAQLRDVFGMEMVELPRTDPAHLTAAERKKRTAAAASSSSSSQAQARSTNVWVLRTTLPAAYRTAAIVAPSRTPTAEQEAAYVGLYTWVVAVITIAGGQISQSALERHLTRVNANVNTPVGRTAEFLARIQRQGYVEKIVDKNQGEDDQVSYVVGSRGRTEISKEALAEHIREVYGPNKPPGFEEQLAVTLGLKRPVANGAAGDEVGEAREQE